MSSKSETRSEVRSEASLHDDHSSGVGQKRRLEEESATPAWAAMKLRSSKPTRTVEEEKEKDAAVPPWSGVQLWGTKSHETPAPYGESASLHVEEQKEPQHAAVDCEQPRSDNSEHSTAKKPPLVKSFVRHHPTQLEAFRGVNQTGVPPSKGGHDQSSGTTPWGNIQYQVEVSSFAKQIKIC